MNTRALMLSFLSVVTLGGCAGLMSSLWSPSPATVADRMRGSEEQIVGNKLAAFIEKRARLARAEAAELVAAVSARLLPVAQPEAKTQLAVKLLDDLDKANAFEIPGGTVYIYSGLLLEIADEDELAAVVAHELGHASARHALKKTAELLGASALMGLATADAAASGDPTQNRVVAELGAGFMLGGAAALRSPEQESEADRRALTYLRAAGYQPQALANLLQRLPQQKEGPSLSLRGSHPPTAERVAAVRRLAGAHPAAPPPETETAGRLLALQDDLRAERARRRQPGAAPPAPPLTPTRAETSSRP